MLTLPGVLALVSWCTKATSKAASVPECRREARRSADEPSWGSACKRTASFSAVKRRQAGGSEGGGCWEDPKDLQVRSQGRAWGLSWSQ